MYWGTGSNGETEIANFVHRWALVNSLDADLVKTAPGNAITMLDGTLNLA